MEEQPNQSTAANAGTTSRATEATRGEITARKVLLEEARTAASQQLGQIDKLDTAAVRTVRIVFVVAGILVGSLFGSLYVYGTSRLFVGSGPAELEVEYEKSSSVEDARVEVIQDYEDGIRRNWRALYVNGFVLALSRSLLAVAVVLVLVGITFPL